MSTTEPSVWVVSELYYPEETSTGHVMTTVAEGLAEHFPTRVVCAQPTYSRRGTVASRSEIRKGVVITRVRSTTRDPGSMAGRLINMVSISLSTFVHLIRHLRRGDVVFVVTNPPVAPYLASLASKLRGATMVLIVHDLFPEIVEVATGQSKFWHRIAHRASSRLYGSVGGVVAIGGDQLGRIVSKLRRKRTPESWVIPLSFDPTFEAPMQRDTSRFFRESLDTSLQDRVVFQFAGNVGPLQGVDFLTAALNREDRSDVHFCFVGAGRSLGRLVEEVGRAQLSHVSFSPWRPRAEAPDLHAGCDVILISLAAGMYGVSVPSRIGNALASGRPILGICEPGSTLDVLVTDHEVGLVVRPGDIEGFWKAVDRLAADPEMRAKMGASARQLAEAEYGESLMVERYVDVAEAMLAGVSL